MVAAKLKARRPLTVPDGVAPAPKVQPGISHDGSLATGLGPEHVLDIQRARILAAMVEMSAERGAANVTVAHIVERARVSRRTFYELYRDREECFLGAFEDAVGRASHYVLDDYDPSARWDARVRSALVGLLTFLELERGAGQLLIVGSLGAGARALELRRGLVVQMIALVDEGRLRAKAGADLPALTAEGIVGGVLSVLHARLIDAAASPALRHDAGADSAGDSSACAPHEAVGEEGMLALTGPLMSMIVLPYLGPPAARRELARPTPKVSARLASPRPADPLRDVRMRLTYRTVRVLAAVAAHPGCSNREVGLAADMQDQGQISKLLTRLSGLGLIENSPPGHARGTPNAWILTPKGAEIERAIGPGGATE